MSPKSQTDTGAKPWVRPRPGWVWLASWAFWLLVAGTATGLPAHALHAHADALRQSHHAFRLRAEICKRLAASPRPPADECWKRGGEFLVNLVAAGNSSDPP